MDATVQFWMVGYVIFLFHACLNMAVSIPLTDKSMVTTSAFEPKKPSFNNLAFCMLIHMLLK